MNFPNIVVAQLGKMMGFAFGAIASSFSDLVLHVVFGSSKKEMTWVDAWRIIAQMKNKYTLWDFPLVDKVRKPMSANSLLIDPERSISIIKLTAGPEPAPFRLVNMKKKSIFVCHIPRWINGALATLSLIVLIAESFREGWGRTLATGFSFINLKKMPWYGFYSSFSVISIVAFLTHTLGVYVLRSTFNTMHKCIPLFNYEKQLYPTVKDCVK